MKFTDHITIKGIDFFYCNNGSKSYIYSYDGNNFIDIYPTGFNIDSDSPTKFFKGKGPYGAKTGGGTFTSGATYIEDNDPDELSLLPGYTGGYINLNYNLTSGDILEGDIVYYKGGILNGGANKIYKDTGSQISVIGTNIRGLTPKSGNEFSIYKEISSTILVGHKNGLSALTINGNSLVEEQIVCAEKDILDVEILDSNIFVLTENKLLHSRTTYDDNMQFFPLDFFHIENGRSLITIGESLLVLADVNKIVSAVSATVGNAGYVTRNGNWNGNEYNKEALFFGERTAYVVQDDKRLMEIDITKSNSTTFDIVTKDIMKGTKGMFDELEGGKFFISNIDRFLNFFYVKDGKTINYQYDKQCQHWLVNEYDVEIYASFRTYNAGLLYLCDGYICKEEGYTDLGNNYLQEINFSIYGEEKMYRPNIIRTIFGLVDNNFNVNLDISFELGARLETIHKDLTGFHFDNRLNEGITGDELLEDETTTEETIYDGSVASIQSNIFKLGRYINFKYSSTERFSIGPSFIIADSAKTFINELSLTN